MKMQPDVRVVRFAAHNASVTPPVQVFIPLDNLDRLDHRLLQLSAALDLAQCILDKRQTHGDAAVRTGLHQVFGALHNLLR